ncbi:cilia- and flagella-associated protein 61 [Polymixia lowei]
MRTITSACGREESVTLRRTESSDAVEIDGLISPSTLAVFGRVNVIHVLEKTNLAVTVANEKNEVLAHASFLDYPIGDIVDQGHWEPFLHKHFCAEKCTPLNTLFLHLFVAQPSFSSASIKEIVRAVFNVTTELQYICLVSPYVSVLEPALEEIFEPLKRLSDPAPQCLAFICHRHNHCPRLHVRQARVEDLDDLTQIFAEQSKELSESYGPFSLAELIEAPTEERHAAVCESGGTAVGFMSVSASVHLELLKDCFELRVLNGLCKPQRADQSPAPRWDHMEDEHARQNQTSTPQDVTEKQENRQDPASMAPGGPSEEPNAFCIQLFVIDKNYEMRSADFLPYIFKLFPDRDFCVVTVPQLAPELPLLYSFLRVAPHPNSTLRRDLYVYHRSGLHKSFEVRRASSADRPAVSAMVERLSQHEALLEDLDGFCQARRDPDGTPVQAFVAQVLSQVVGILIIRSEEDIEFIRSHYNIENFIYFSHHGYEEHAQMCHFALNPIFQHYAKHFLKEGLRLAHKSCLYYRVYPPQNIQKRSCVHPLTSVLNCTVPIRPRRQVAYPLEELGINAPSRLITQDQAPYALNLVSRKLTMEPKVTINARIVLVGASETGLSFLEVLAFCPHLQFNNITLVSTHGLPGNHDYNHDNNHNNNNHDPGFLSTTHAYSSRDYGLLSLRSCVNVVTGKMVSINREDKHILVTGSRVVPYDHLILCTGQQYQVPCPTGIDTSQAVSKLQTPASSHRRYHGHIPSNLLTLNHLQDCVAAQRWLSDNFVELEDNAVVYGSSIDVYTCVETLLGLGVQGSRVHLVVLPTEPGVSRFGDPRLERALERALEKAEVRVHRNCLLARMNDGEHPEPLTSVSFTTDGQPLCLTCGVFINLSSKEVDYDAFKSINDACLVYDGRLVIDTAFHTNDPSIRAAGPLTKFSRRYHSSDRCSHADFNSGEVGRDLAATMLPLFDPTLEPDVGPPPDGDRLIPDYTQAKIQGGRLPGGYNYLHVTKPSVAPPAGGTSLGRDILTGRVETGNYFCVHLNRYETVESITCLSLKAFPVSNYLCLYGKHQLLLNHLSARYDEGLIHDLYSFFRERWSLVLYHDRFSDFELELQQILASTSLQDHDSASVPELIRQLVSGGLDPPEDPMLFLQEVFEKSAGLAALRSSTVNYLSYNRNHLPMYALPGL